MFRNSTLLVDQKHYKLYKAHHQEVISQYDFKQGAFQNTFIYYDQSRNFCISAILSKTDCFLSLFSGYDDVSPRIDYSNSNNLDLSFSKFPKTVNLSLEAIHRDRFLSLDRVKTTGKYKDIIIAKDEKKVFSGIKVSRDTYHCAGVSIDSLISSDPIQIQKPVQKPTPLSRLDSLLKSFNSNFCESPSFILKKIENGNVFVSTG